MILALNKKLKQLNVLACIRFSKRRYSYLSAISDLAIEESNTEDLLRDYSTILIKVIKSEDKKVINVKALEPWYRLKINEMPLLHYLRERNVELIC